MVTRDEYNAILKSVTASLDTAGIAVTRAELEKLEVADFGLSKIYEMGLQIITYINTERCCSKELILLPGQICPEHRHPSVGNKPGKEETFRCRKGVVYLYVSGIRTTTTMAKTPSDKANVFTVFHEITLNPGDQYTLGPDTLHWFQAGNEGAIVSEFSTTSRDEYDIWTDAEIIRKPQIEQK